MEKKIIGTRDGWEKFENNPVLGGELGVCFDICVLEDNGGYKMFFSWRSRASVAVTTSKDGLSWSEPYICVAPITRVDGWEDDINRPYVIKKDGIYHMWYTGQFKPGAADGNSRIFYATSENGKDFTRSGSVPVLVFDHPWEKVAVMNPTLMWDEEENLFKMWYSGGEQYEPNAIGYATSPDGTNWEKYAGNPIFSANPNLSWERHKVAGPQVIKTGDWYTLFYIGYFDEDYAQIGIARSKDGISNWERHPQNPIIAPTPDGFDGEACYKPFVAFDGTKWLMWYNGRVGANEQIGVVSRQGYDLGFEG